MVISKGVTSLYVGIIILPIKYWCGNKAGLLINIDRGVYNFNLYIC